MNQPEAKYIREALQQLVRNFGLLQREGTQCCGITVMQSHVLYELTKRSNISLNDLSDGLKVDTGSLSRQINNLVDLGYVNRTPDPRDRRYVVLSLSEAGQAKAEEISTLMAADVRDMFNRIPEEKHEQVLESLKLLSDAMAGAPAEPTRSAT